MAYKLSKSLALLLLASLFTLDVRSATVDEAFIKLSEQYIDQFPPLHPVAATALGDHRFDDRIDEVGPDAVAKEVAFCKQYLERLRRISRDELSRANQVDYSLLSHKLEARIFSLETLREWEWNPTVYTGLAGSSVYSLMAREFAPREQRLNHVAKRLEQFPRLFKQIQATLIPKLSPQIHAETAVKQNRGVISILKNMVEPHIATLPGDERTRLIDAIDLAKAVVDEHQKWLENEVLPNASGDFRLGVEKYDRKLFFTLNSSLTRQQVLERAQSELKRVREEMHSISKEVYRKTYPFTTFPPNPSPEHQQAIIRAGLELAYRDVPAADEIVATAKKSLAETTAFVRERDLVTVPDDPLEIIVMPEFQRGVSLAYCDSPGALDVGQKTFYAVAPLPKHWDDKQINSFLREYNIRSIHDLTIHEAMPGHFLQLAHSNRYSGKLRAVLSSGTFIEGWAVYTEQVMADEGFLDHDPLMKLIALKWYLRGIANAILDQAIHTVGFTRDQAMKLMMEDTFQEEREAAAKWVRAQLTSAQLSTYFVGYQEHVDMRKAIEESWGDSFQLKRYHDTVLSYGSPPVKYVKALVLNQQIP